MSMGILQQCTVLEMEPIEVGKFAAFSEILENLKFLFFAQKTAFLMLKSDKNSVISSEGLHALVF